MSCEPPPRRRPCHNSPDSRSNEQAYVRKTDLYALQDLFPSPEKVCKPASRRIYRLVQTIDDNNTRWFEVYVYRFSVRSNPKKIDPQQKRDLVGRFPLRYFHVVRFLLKIINDCIWHRVALEEEKKAKRVESNIADTYLTNADAQFWFHSNLLELALKQISEDPSARLPLLDAWALVQYWGRGPLVNDTNWPKLKALKEFGDPLNFENLENRYNWTAWAQGEERRRAARMAVFSSRPFRDNNWVLQDLEEKTCKSWGVKLGPVDVSSGIEFGHWPLFVELTVQYARAPSEDVIKISQEEVNRSWGKGRRGTSRSTRNSIIVDINGDLIVDDDSEQSAESPSLESGEGDEDNESGQSEKGEEAEENVSRSGSNTQDDDSGSESEVKSANASGDRTETSAKGEIGHRESDAYDKDSEKEREVRDSQRRASTPAESVHDPAPPADVEMKEIGLEEETNESIDASAADLDAPMDVEEGLGNDSPETAGVNAPALSRSAKKNRNKRRKNKERKQMQQRREEDAQAGPSASAARKHERQLSDSDSGHGRDSKRGRRDRSPALGPRDALQAVPRPTHTLHPHFPRLLLQLN